VVVGGCGCGWVSLGKSGSCSYDREFSWNKTAKLQPDPAGCVDSTTLLISLKVGIGGESMPKNKVTLWITLIRRKKISHLLILAQGPRQQFLHVVQTRCVCSTYCINYCSQQIYTKSRIPPIYHIKLALVTYST
jgi:hypothetical protein